MSPAGRAVAAWRLRRARVAASYLFLANCTALDTQKHQSDSSYSRLGSVKESPMTPSLLNKDWTPKDHYKACGSRGYFPAESPDQGGNQKYNVSCNAYATGGPKGEVEAPRTSTSSRDEASVSVSNASDVESEWVEQDETGVYISIRQLGDGTRELRRVRFRYGGGPPLARRVISSGLSQTELTVVVYPLRLQLHLIPEGDQSSIRISKKKMA